MHADEKQRVAYHESGHALVAYSLPNTDPVHKVSIIPRGLAALGYTMQTARRRPLSADAKRIGIEDPSAAGRNRGRGNDLQRRIDRAQNDLERATEIARSMVMDYGMSPLGRITYRESRHSPFLMGADDFARDRSHSEQTAREIDEEIRKIISQSLEKVRHMLETRRQALVAMAERLIEKEVIDTAELKELVETNSPSPMIVPGTDETQKRRSPEETPLPESKANP